jgi:hypothetical protein
LKRSGKLVVKAGITNIEKARALLLLIKKSHLIAGFFC